MKKLFLLLIMCGLFPIQAHAMKAIFTFGSSSNASADATFWGIDSVAAGSATETQKMFVVPFATKITNLSIQTNAAPTAGNSISWTLMVNGSPSTLTCTIADANLICSDTTHTVQVVKGDYISIKTATAGGTPTFSAFSGYMFQEIENDNYNEIIGSGSSSSTLATGATNYTGPFLALPAATESQRQFVMPINGVISKMQVRLSGTPAAGKSYLFTFRKNGSDQTLTCSVADTATTCEDQFDSFSVAPGDLISVSSVPTGTPTARSITVSAVFRSETPGFFIKSASSGSGTMSASVANYIDLSGIITNATSTINQASYFPANLSIRKMYAYLFTAPDAGAGVQSYTVALRNSTAGAVTKTSCIISDTNQACEFHYPVFLPASEFKATMGFTPTSTPTVSTASVGTVFTLTEPAYSEIRAY